MTVPKEAKKAIMKNKPFEVEKVLKSTPVSNKEEKLLGNTLVSGVEKVLKSTPVSNKQPIIKNNNNISFDMSALIEDIFDEEEVKSNEKKKKNKRVSWGDNTEHSPVKVDKLEG